jgi:hypothetical protein
MTRSQAPRTAALLAVLAVPLLLGACADDGERTSAPPPSETATQTTTAESEPVPLNTTTTDVDVTAPSSTEETNDEPPPVSTPTEPTVATTEDLERRAPPVRDGPLRFARIVVVAESGRFAGRANVRNAGSEFLNDVRLRWRIVDADGNVLDSGVTTWPTLAPAEVATVHFAGSKPYRSAWRRVLFERVG